MSDQNNRPRPAVSPLYRNPPPRPPKNTGDSSTEEGGTASSSAIPAGGDAFPDRPETLAEEKLAPEDDLTLASSKVVDWVVRHRDKMIGAAAGLVVIGIGMALWNSHQDDKNMEAAAETFKVMKDLPEFGGAPERPDLPTLDAATGADSSSKKAEQYKSAAKALEGVAGNYGGGSSATVANLYAGYSHLQANQGSEALKAFQAGLAGAKDQTLKYFAYNGMVAAQAQVGNDDGAIDTLKKMSTELDGVWQESALLDLGRSLEGLAKRDEAATAYETLLKDHPASAFATSARERLTVLKPDAAVLAVKPPEAPASE